MHLRHKKLYTVKFKYHIYEYNFSIIKFFDYFSGTDFLSKIVLVHILSKTTGNNEDCICDSW